MKNTAELIHNLSKKELLQLSKRKTKLSAEHRKGYLDREALKHRLKENQKLVDAWTEIMRLNEIHNY